MWKSRRRIAALGQGLLFLSLPFLRLGGESALRFDIPSLTLHLFGTAIGIDEFHLVLAGILFLLLLAVAGAVALGRLWCGWSCPQTLLPELAAWAVEILPPPLRGPGARAVLALLSAAVALSLVALFVPAAGPARALAASPAVQGAFLVLWGSVFALSGLAGTRFCRSVCPYAMLQNAVADNETLAVAFDAARSGECLRCGRCQAACPVGIDIREGRQRECLACPCCIDACAAATASAGIAPFVAYRGRVVRGKPLALASAAGVALAALVIIAAARPGVDFSIQWEGALSATGANRYRYAVRNGLERPVDLALRVEGGFALVGVGAIHVDPGSRRTGSVLVKRAGGGGSRPTFILSGDGVTLRREAGFL